MKNLLLTALVSLLVVSANAQTGAPKELTCTEEAFTFSTSIGSGWHFSKPLMGPADGIKSRPVYTDQLPFTAGELLLQIQESPKAALPFIAINAEPAANSYKLDRIYHPFKFQLTDKLGYTVPTASNTWQPANYQFIKANFPAN
jgi:hypothetical protein